jgi:small conductance mechanosensitive channel
MFPVVLDFFLKRILPAFAIFAVSIVVGYFLGKLCRIVARRIPHADETVERLAGRIGSWLLYLFGVLAALRALGVDTSAALAALGALGVAVGLGFKDTLGDVAAGLQLILLRPLAVGEYISYQGPGDPRAAGTVVRIGLFATQLRTPEGLFVSVNNRLLAQNAILNYDRNSERMVRIDFSISYSDSIDAAVRALMQLGNGEPRRLEGRPTEVYVETMGDSAIVLSMRVWVQSRDYWPARRALMAAGKPALEAAGVTIPFPQLDVHLQKD